MAKQRAELTFKDNLQQGRHGWLRLTPAYSVRLVRDILNEQPTIKRLLEPFSGSGTTGLVAAERGLHCDLYDINPFLIWLARVKCTNYNEHQLSRVRDAADAIVSLARSPGSQADDLWLPPISNIERWWEPDRLAALAQLFQALNQVLSDASAEKDLLLVAFCRVIIQWSNAAFNHQSMSFRQDVRQASLFDERGEIFQTFLAESQEIIASAREPLPGSVRTLHHDARDLALQDAAPYDAVITSPPYVNRMSYIRELRPYMYWLGYLDKPSDAGELDWKAIGGTWGIATSRLNHWAPDEVVSGSVQLAGIVSRIARSSELLSRYVHRYFFDMAQHFASLRDVVAPGGRLFYIIGNSKFYDTLVPAEAIYAELMLANGFVEPQIEAIRKRNSKKELFEYLVTARKPLS